MARRPPPLKSVPNNYFASRKHLDDAETAINYARRIVVGKLSEASVTELAAVAAAHGKNAQAAASQALVRSNELLVHELRQLNSRGGLPLSASDGPVAF
jgi:hypothetical protein